jgi:hypothetical protein
VSIVLLPMEAQDLHTAGASRCFLKGFGDLTWLSAAHSPVRLLHQEPPCRALLAEDTAADGGDGVSDPRGNPQR